MGFLSALANKVTGTSRAIGSKLVGGSRWLGSKLDTVGGVVANVATKAIPAATAINPALGAGVAQVAAGAKAAQIVGKTITGVTDALRNRDFVRAGVGVQSGINQVRGLNMMGQ